MPNDDTFTCPNCGAEVPAKAKACPECGADEKTGWSDNTIYDGTDIADPGEDDFQYEEWKRRELGGGKRRGRRDWLWWVVGVLILAALAWLFVVRRWCAIP
ncbi:MAG TPA: zinc ribbon domain-containing protein [Verrucomicrobiae bacterium]|nr:zinc ribbon domain-containing protein [Verrucomicrobiae bacterium]